MKSAEAANSAMEVFETKLRVRYAETDQMGSGLSLQLHHLV